MSDNRSSAPPASARPWILTTAFVALVIIAAAGWSLGRGRRAAERLVEQPSATALPPGATVPLAATAPVTGPATIDPARLANRLMDVAWLVPEVVATFPHSTTAFTQGLLLHDGLLYESTGQKGESSLREVDPATGEVLRLLPNDPNVFAEGLALVDDRLIQLTWMDQKAYVYDRATFEPIDEFDYEGQGWGLCYDGQRLVMSDGSDRLTFRDPETFAELGTVFVNIRGKALAQLNELECVGDEVWANVWQADTIVGIRAADGNVFAHVDASDLVRDARVTSPEDIDVLNGIAHDPQTDHWYLTGKYWPKLYEVRFVPRPTAAAP